MFTDINTQAQRIRSPLLFDFGHSGLKKVPHINTRVDKNYDIFKKIRFL